jgi:hypothetical protein
MLFDFNIKTKPKNNRTREETNRIIDNMLGELNMSKQELVDVLTAIFGLNQEQRISIEEEVFITENISPSQTPAQNLSSDSVKPPVKKTRLMDFFSQDGFKKVTKKMFLLYRIEVLRSLGLEIKISEIAKILENLSIENFTRSLEIQVGGTKRQLSSAELNKLSTAIDSKIRDLATGKMPEGVISISQANLEKEVKGISTDPTSRQSNIFKSISVIGEKLQNFAVKIKDVASQISQNVSNGLPLKNLLTQVKKIEGAKSAINSFGKKIKDLSPEIRSIKFKPTGVEIELYKKDLEEGQKKKIHLQDFLKDKGLLNDMLKNFIEDATKIANEIEHSIGEISKAMSIDISSLKFDKNAKLTLNIGGSTQLLTQVIQTQNLQMRIARSESRRRNRENIARSKESKETDGKKQEKEEQEKSKEKESQTEKKSKNSELKDEIDKLEKSQENIQKIEREQRREMRRESRAQKIEAEKSGKEKDGKSKEKGGEEGAGAKKDENAGSSSSSQKEIDTGLSGKIMSGVQATSLVIGESVKEQIKDTRDKLVLQDIISDKAKLMEGMKDIKSSLGAVMKDMGAAMENKDLLAQLKKEQLQNKGPTKGM